MKKYRVKQVGDKFYPQYKMFFGWGYYRGEPNWRYNWLSDRTVYWDELFFNSLEKANNFIIETKKADTVSYHDIKEN